METISVKKGTVVYIVNKENDMIISYFDENNPKKVETLENTTFQSMFGVTAEESTKAKKKVVIIKKTAKIANNNSSDSANQKPYAKKPYTPKRGNKPFNKNGKKPFNNKFNNKNKQNNNQRNKKPSYKVTYNNTNCVDKTNYLVYLNTQMEKKIKDLNGKIIATFPHVLKTENLPQENLCNIEADFLYVKYKDGDQLKTINNPLLPDFIPMIFDKLRECSSFILIPYKDEIIKALSDADMSVNIMTPTDKESYLNHLKDMGGQSNMIERMEKYYDTFIQNVTNLAQANAGTIEVFETSDYGNVKINEIIHELI